MPIVIAHNPLRLRGHRLGPVARGVRGAQGRAVLLEPPELAAPLAPWLVPDAPGRSRAHPGAAGRSPSITLLTLDFRGTGPLRPVRNVAGRPCSRPSARRGDAVVRAVRQRLERRLRLRRPEGRERQAARPSSTSSRATRREIERAEAAEQGAAQGGRHQVRRPTSRQIGAPGGRRPAHQLRPLDRDRRGSGDGVRGRAWPSSPAPGSSADRAGSRRPLGGAAHHRSRLRRRRRASTATRRRRRRPRRRRGQGTLAVDGGIPVAQDVAERRPRRHQRHRPQRLPAGHPGRARSCRRSRARTPPRSRVQVEPLADLTSLAYVQVVLYGPAELSRGRRGPSRAPRPRRPGPPGRACSPSFTVFGARRRRRAPAGHRRRLRRRARAGRHRRLRRRARLRPAARHARSGCRRSSTTWSATWSGTFQTSVLRAAVVDPGADRGGGQRRRHGALRRWWAASWARRPSPAPPLPAIVVVVALLNGAARPAVRLGRAAGPSAVDRTVDRRRSCSMTSDTPRLRLG